MSKAELSLVKNINYSLVWEHMLSVGEITIATVSDKLKLSFPTVSRAVEYGLECGLLSEGAQQESAVGRKATKYKINPDYSHIMVIITDSGMLRGIVLDMLGIQVCSCERNFEYADFNNDIVSFVSWQKAKDNAIAIVGIALECVVSNGIIVDWAKNPTSVGFNLGQYLSQHLGMQIIIDNNMKALALGAAMHKANCGDLTIATLQNGYSGFGASMVVGGEVLRGATNFAGEIGYLPKSKSGVLGKTKFVEFAQTIISIINPHKIIVYDKFSDIDVELLELQLGKVIPSYAIPEIIKSNNFFIDCANGIYQLVKREIFKMTLKM